MGRHRDPVIDDNGVRIDEEIGISLDVVAHKAAAGRGLDTHAAAEDHAAGVFDVHICLAIDGAANGVADRVGLHRDRTEAEESDVARVNISSSLDVAVAVAFDVGLAGSM